MQQEIGQNRFLALDQFRGYTVAAMYLVNFIGGFAAVHDLFRHHDAWCSYADLVMPQFHFAVGFSFRLTFLKRMRTVGYLSACTHSVSRNFTLIFLGLMLYSIDANYDSWSKLSEAGPWGVLKSPLKIEWWQTINIIAVTSIWLTPWIGTRAAVRVVILIASILAHFFLAHLFFFHFMYGKPNFVDPVFGTSGMGSIDGGPFGFISWGIAQLIGSLAYDVAAYSAPSQSIRKFLISGIALVFVGYATSCVGTLYRVLPGAPAPSADYLPTAASPVVPPPINWQSRSLTSFLAPLPFTPPPPPEEYPYNDWMMIKRVVSVPFLLFTSGVSLATLAFFIGLTDLTGIQIPFFRILGQNALAAYVFENLAYRMFDKVRPSDSPLWWVCLLMAGVYLVTYTAMKFLESRNLYLKA